MRSTRKGWSRDGGTDNAGNSLGQLEQTDNDITSFGRALAWGDFNNDGYSDLALGIPDEIPVSGSITKTGAVQVLYGSADGLRAINTQYITQDGIRVDPEGDGSSTLLGDIAGSAEVADSFGQAVASGDFNGDGFDDLAIGVPGEEIAEFAQGAVSVVYGSAAGLSWENNQFISQDQFTQEDNGLNTYTTSGDMIGGGEILDQMGSVLATGDINNDGYDELVIGVPLEDISTTVDAGAIIVISGSITGLTSTNNQFIHQGNASIDSTGDGTSNLTLGNPQDTEETDDQFGSALVLGDFNDDQFDDVAVGVWREDAGSGTQHGVVQVFYGSAGFLDLAREDFIVQDNIAAFATGMLSGNLVLGGDPPENFDHFGYSLSVGDYNGDSIADLAIGARQNNNTNTGSVDVIFGSASGLINSGHTWISPAGGFDQDVAGPVSAGIAGIIVSFSTTTLWFGVSLMSADFDADGFSDLAIGANFYEIIGETANTGAIHTIQGSAAGLRGGNDQLWTMNGGINEAGDDLGVLVGNPLENDQFGLTLP